ncbi:MAG: hypothetical protein LIO94_03760 [Clostridiales bacterium]|nr:hypothetical protein [Clostridiales bacterium]
MKRMANQSVKKKQTETDTKAKTKMKTGANAQTDRNAKKKNSAGTAHSATDGFARHRNYSILFLLIVVFGYLIFFRNSLSESVYIEPGEDSILINSYTEDEITVSYADITRITLTDEVDFGTLVEGSDDRRVRSGVWENEEWGEYYLFALKKVESDYLILETEEKVIVFNYESAEVTQTFYTSFQEYLEGLDLQEIEYVSYLE